MDSCLWRPVLNSVLFNNLSRIGDETYKPSGTSFISVIIPCLIQQPVSSSPICLIRQKKLTPICGKSVLLGAQEASRTQALLACLSYGLAQPYAATINWTSIFFPARCHSDACLLLDQDQFSGCAATVELGGTWCGDRNLQLRGFYNVESSRTFYGPRVSKEVSS